MTSVSSATGALAALQTLSLQTPSAAHAGAAATASAPALSVAAQDTVAASSPSQSLFSLGDAASHALSAADAAGAAGQTVLGVLQRMQGLAGQAAQSSTSDAQRTGMDHAYRAGLGDLDSAIDSASVGGTNLIDGSAHRGMQVTLAGGATVSLSPVDLSLSGPTLGAVADSSVATASAAAQAHLTLGNALGTASQGLTKLQAQADQIDAHLGFVHQLGQAMASGGDVDGDSARLLALQVSQQLSSGTSAIANAAPQSVLALFRS